MIRIQLDKAARVANINHQGATRSLSGTREIEMIVSWAGLHIPDPYAMYITDLENWKADYLRQQHLDPKVFLDISHR